MSTLSIVREVPSKELSAPICNDKSVTAESCNAWFGELSRALWPKKPAASLQHLTGCKERGSYAYAAGTTEPPASILRALLWSDQGWRVLEWLMHGCSQPWWAEVRRARIVADAFDSANRQIGQQLQLNI